MSFLQRRAALLLIPVLATSGCENPPGPGPFGAVLIVTVGTTGEDVERGGLRISLDGGPSRLVPETGAIEFARVDPGEHTIELTGIAANCALVGNNPFTIELGRGESRRLSLIVHCVRRTGTVRVITSTQGPEPDPDGYRLLIGGEPAAVPPGNQETYRTLPVGSHGVQIEQVARNCEVAGSALRTATVTFLDTTDVSFAVQCQQSGTLEVEIVASGQDLDQDGYVVHLTGIGPDTAAAIAPDVLATFAGFMPGEYELVVRRVAANCDVVEAQPRLVQVSAGEVSRSTVSVDCKAAGRLAFVSERDGNPEIYVIRTDETLATRLTNSLGRDVNPAWSPDGSRLAFSSDREGDPDIYIMDADGANVVRLTTTGAVEDEPAWSPDGTRIAFVSGSGETSDIYVVNADGSSPVRLTDFAGWDGDPAWSRDGSRIAFSSGRGGSPAIYLMDSNGSNVTALTTGLTNDFDPAWSPDGSRVAFARLSCSYYYDSCADGIIVMNADGSSAKVIAPGSAQLADPSWSPDGRKIAFGSLSYDYYDCYYYCYSINVARLDGTDLFPLVESEAYDPAWRPE